MAIGINKQNGHTSYNTFEFIIDEESDVQDLPKTCAPGSNALCVASSDVYILNNQKEWVKL